MKFLNGGGDGNGKSPFYKRTHGNHHEYEP